MKKHIKDPRNWIVTVACIPLASFFLFGSVALWFGESTEPTWQTAIARILLSLLFFVLFSAFAYVAYKGNWRYLKEVLIALFTAF